MKKLITTLFLIVSICHIIYSQNTNCGPSSSTLGTNNSNFGAFTGNLASSTAASNSFGGFNSGGGNINGQNNTAIGSYSLYGNAAIVHGTDMYYNTAIGSYALFGNLGSGNTALGGSSMELNSTGNFNTAAGDNSAANILYTSQNTAIGSNSLHTQGPSGAVALGDSALYNDVSGNTALGHASLKHVTNGGCVASGYQSAYYLTSGLNNTAVGFQALLRTTTGSDNAADGYLALANNVTGSQNSAFGYSSGPGPSFPNLTNSTSLGNGATAIASNQVFVGNSSVSVTSTGIFMTVSDGRFKIDIKEDVAGLSFINSLRPVSYDLDLNAFDRFIGASQIQTANTVHKIGFIAQEVEIAVQKSGLEFDGVRTPENDKQPYALTHSSFVVPLVKSIQELTQKAAISNRKIENQQKTLQSIYEQQKLAKLSNSTNAPGILLFQNFPNPFNRETQINIYIPDSSNKVSLVISDSKGVVIKNIPIKDHGNLSITIGANEFIDGVYIFSLYNGSILVDSKKMILTK